MTSASPGHDERVSRARRAALHHLNVVSRGTMAGRLLAPPTPGLRPWGGHRRPAGHPARGDQLSLASSLPRIHARKGFALRRAIQDQMLWPEAGRSVARSGPFGRPSGAGRDVPVERLRPLYGDPRRDPRRYLLSRTEGGAVVLHARLLGECERRRAGPGPGDRLAYKSRRPRTSARLLSGRRLNPRSRPVERLTLGPACRADKPP